ncbi:MAG: aldo/keto reductase [Chlamydiales bacterium]|nr:aldo/keto reductase [Chlamydiales bacterium]
MVPLQKRSRIPLVGLGTWQLSGRECEKVVEQALEVGYRHIDTADAYENHKAVGKAIRSFPRKDLFLTSKVALHKLEPKQIREAVPRFLEELKTPYLDLLLIHWPDPDVDLAESLKTMFEFKELGLVREIGVSNFVRAHLEIFMRHQLPILTNQIEMHPYLQRRELVAAYKKQKITITAYRPLGKGALVEEPVLQKIGESHGKSASQVALRWLVQQDIVAIPKASSPKHLKDNIDIFDFVLTKEEMQKIHALDAGKRYCDPEGYPVLED